MSIWKYARAQWDRVAAGAFVIAGALALLLGWSRAGQEALAALQVPYLISGGLGGLFLLGLGTTCWISADLRDDWRKIDDLEAALRDLAGAERTPDAFAAAAAAAVVDLEVVTEPAPEADQLPRRSRRARTIPLEATT